MADPRAANDLREQIAVLWPYLDFVERYEWCRRVAWAESGGSFYLDGTVRHPGSDEAWPEVAAAIAKLVSA